MASAAEIDHHDLPLGSLVLGRYRIVRALAKGGMGTIYLARSEGAAGFVRPVVIKRSLRTGDSLFAREARILSALRHPEIVSIIEFAEVGGEYYMVLDYVHGYTAAHWYRFAYRVREELPAVLALHVILRVLAALEYAHQLRGPDGSPLHIVHRDIKPSNVLIDVDGAVKLADFGVARTNTEMTDAGEADRKLKGTFPYMAPELLSREEPSQRTDVYSAAVMLYELLAGRNPFSMKDLAATVGRVLKYEPKPIHELRADVSPALGNVVAKGMCKHPEGRYQSAAELAAALTAALPEARDADAAFRATVARDFHDPAFARAFDIDSLEVRAEAWSTWEGDDAPPLRTASSAEGDELHDLATRLDTGDASTESRRPPYRLVAALAVTAVLIAGAAVAVALQSKSEKPQAPTVLMVRGDVTMAGAEDAGPAPGEASSAAPPDASGTAAASDDSGSPDAAPERSAPPRQRPERKPPPAASFTRSFRARASDIERCFERYSSTISGAPELSVRVRIEGDGSVTGAKLLPPKLSPTPLGQCLIEVARSTRFEATGKQVTVRIPITVRQR